jgi:flavoprotein
MARCFAFFRISKVFFFQTLRWEVLISSDGLVIFLGSAEILDSSIHEKTLVKTCPKVHLRRVNGTSRLLCLTCERNRRCVNGHVSLYNEIEMSIRAARLRFAS